MCMKTDHALVNLGGASDGGSSGSGVSVTKYALDPDQFSEKARVSECIVIDVREPGEEGEVPDSVNYPMGRLLRDAMDEKLPAEWKGMSLVLVCNAGYRASITVKELRDLSIDAYYLDGGVQALGAPRSAWFKPDYYVLLMTTEPEKATMALSAVTASQVNGTKTALILMGPAVVLFREKSASLPESEPQLRYEDLAIGEPFKTGKQLVTKFLGSGGTIFACKSCVSHHKLSYEHMEDGVDPLQAPDLVRMSKIAKGGLTVS